MALKIPYVGPLEISNHEMSEKYNYPAFFYKKINELPPLIQHLLDLDLYPVISKKTLDEIKKEVDTEMQNLILND